MSMRKLKDEIELFYTYLRRHGRKKTYQKDLILETFLNTEGHLSVEDIYALVKKRDKKIGVVTVFRTLKLFTECGIAREVNLGDGLTRFEHNFRHPEHHHIICQKCHRAIEFVCPELERIQEKILQNYDFQPVHHRFQTYGLCADCRGQRAVSDMPKHDTNLIFARDVVKLALHASMLFQEFYREAERRSQDYGGREAFSRMIQAEESQIFDLNNKLDEVLRQAKDLGKAPVFLHFDLQELQSLIPDLSDHEEGGNLQLDENEAGVVIHSLQHSSAQFFRSHAERFRDTQGGKLMMLFADQEELQIEFFQQSMKEKVAACQGI